MHRVALFALIALAGCHASMPGRVGLPAPESTPIHVPGSHRLGIGQSLTLPDRSTVQYLRLVADSRCRPEVQCIHAGDAEIALRWQPVSGAAVNILLNTDSTPNAASPNRMRVGGWQLRLVALDWQTPPVATLAIASATQPD